MYNVGLVVAAPEVRHGRRGLHDPGYVSRDRLEDIRGGLSWPRVLEERADHRSA